VIVAAPAADVIALASLEFGDPFFDVEAPLLLSI